jgi:hypothetical protein
VFGFHHYRLTRTVVLAAAATASAIAVAGAAVRPPQVRTVAAPSVTSAGVIGQLGHVVTIGSTVDAKNGDQNPYGLAIAPVSAGIMKSGDLIIANFNDAANIQGLGSTLEVLHPVPGSKPVRLSSEPTLTGGDAIAMPSNGDFPWVAAFTANDNPIIGSDGKLAQNLNGNGLAQPWGQAFSGTPGPHGVAAFYETNSNDGSITRINIKRNGSFSFDKIAAGFSVNHGVPGTVLAPAGLSYDSKNDVLYIVDSNVDRVVAFSKPGMIPKNGIVVSGTGFTGPSASSARVVFAGAPLKAPISSALLFNGDLVVGNTSNNRLIEITPAGHVVGQKLLDSGNTGALFGIVATGTSISTTKIYFNDDNDNTVKVLQL